LTPIGWTCVGQISKNSATEQTLFCHDCEGEVAEVLKRFGAIEEVPEGGREIGQSLEEQQAEKIVADSMKLVTGQGNNEDPDCL
jgi:hypothetical protein